MKKDYIVLDHVGKKIKKSTIIEDINLSFGTAGIYGVKGYNGSGKTMLMRLISGLIYPTHGRVIVNCKVLGKECSFPDRLGVLIENPTFLNSYTGFSNLKMLASINEYINDEEIVESLRNVGLDHLDKRKYRKYSLGMKQRLGIAAAIMEKPDIIILDEPTNALDKDGVNMVRDIIKKEKERGALIILSCHEEAFLREVSDEIYTIENGRITESIVLNHSEKEGYVLK